MNNEFIEKHRSFFTKQPETVAIALVGSAVKSSQPHDIDLLLICSSRVKSIKSIRNFSRQNNFNLLKSDDAFRFPELKPEISLVPKSLKELGWQVDSILKGHNLGQVYHPWAVGGFFPEVFLLDLINSSPLWENELHILSKYKKLIIEQLPFFFEIISGYLNEEILLKSAYLSNSTNRNKLFRQTLSNDLKIAKARLGFARKHILFPGLKNFQDG